jgi:hypothetical protein
MILLLYQLSYTATFENRLTDRGFKSSEKLLCGAESLCLLKREDDASLHKGSPGRYSRKAAGRNKPLPSYLHFVIDS